VFHLDVAYVCNGFQVFFKHFPQLFRRLFQSVSSVFRRMLQVLYLDVSKIDRMLHLHPRFLLSRLGVFSSRCWLGIRHPLSLFLDASDIRDGMGPRGR
jgi:hypothetical protein